MTELKEWTEETPKIFAVDESGTSKMFSDCSKRSEENRWFVLSGLIFSQEYNEHNIELIVSLKNKYWDNGFFDGSRVVLHSREIKKGRGAFSPTIIDRMKFLDDLGRTLDEMKFEVITVAIDKHEHFDQYSFPRNPYALAYEFLLERYTMTLSNEKSIVLSESRGQREDTKLENLISGFLRSGGEYIGEDIHKIQSVNFNRKLTRDKKKSHFMLECADLLSYHLHQYLRADKNSEILKIMLKKYCGGKLKSGHNYKVFPPQSYKKLELD